MKFNLKKLTSLMTASLLAAGGLIGVSAVPAQADSPSTTFDFESNAVGGNGWGNMFGFAQNGDGWANTVSSCGKPGRRNQGDQGN